MRNLFILLMVIGLASVSVPTTRAQSGTEEAPPAAEKGMGMHGSMPMQSCRAMMDSMRESDDELARLVARMKEAEGDEKVEALAAVVEALVVQRQSMHARMREMPHAMCGGMTMSR